MSDIDHIAAARALIEPLTGYTPGPWDASGLTVYDTCMDGVASCHAGADARLIAAAPALRDMVATLADEAEADAAEIVSLQDLNTALVAEVEKLRAENQRLRKIIDKMDEHSPRADHTCAEPGIILSEAVMREWPELAEPKDEAPQ